MPIRALFLDCDDCLYQNSWRTEAKITESMQSLTAKLGVSKDVAFEYYQKFGSTLKGLRVNGLIDDDSIEDFLVRAHQIDYSDIKADPALVEVLSKLSMPTCECRSLSHRTTIQFSRMSA